MLLVLPLRLVTCVAGIIAELAHGFEITQTPDGRPFTVVKHKLQPKKEGILVAEAERLQSILAELGVPQHRWVPTHCVNALLDVSDSHRQTAPVNLIFCCSIAVLRPRWR